MRSGRGILLTLPPERRSPQASFTVMLRCDRVPIEKPGFFVKSRSPANIFLETRFLAARVKGVLFGARSPFLRRQRWRAIASISEPQFAQFVKQNYSQKPCKDKDGNNIFCLE
ncbi:MAG: hypothetical protein AB4352_10755 [Hormoscilla sp.]